MQEHRSAEAYLQILEQEGFTVENQLCGMPTAFLGRYGSGSPGHSWQNVATGKSSIAHKGLLLAAKVLAGTAADLMEQPEILNHARQEFEMETAQGYDCPMGKEVSPV